MQEGTTHTPTHEIEIICDVEVCGDCYLEELMTMNLARDMKRARKWRVKVYNTDIHGIQDIYLTTKEWLIFLEEHPEQKPKWMT